jgi:hypothetical protein
LDDGSVIYSSRETVYYLNGKNYLIYPNPVHRGQDLNVLSELPEDQNLFIYDNMGRLVMRQTLTDKIQRISSISLAPGMYHMRIMEGNAVVKKISFVVQ